MSETGAKKRVVKVPVVVFPLGGCAPDGTLTEAQVTARMKNLRELVRMHWNNEGVRAVIELLEMRTAMKQRAGVAPGAGAHEQGQAFALDEAIGMLRQVRMSVEAMSDER